MRSHKPTRLSEYYVCYVTTMLVGRMPKGAYSPRGGVLGTFWKLPSQNPC